LRTVEAHWSWVHTNVDVEDILEVVVDCWLIVGTIGISVACGTVAPVVVPRVPEDVVPFVPVVVVPAVVPVVVELPGAGVGSPEIITPVMFVGMVVVVVVGLVWAKLNGAFIKMLKLINVLNVMFVSLFMRLVCLEKVNIFTDGIQ
jgi:hypothetical protein